ncbi:DUF3866 family protein [Tepidibacillus fermentans]|uniref:Uncharacterized protein DUF3866 n=1 Tax=Tepidibacillus fermentans TaxID=1281767 RepID=A0A4R3KKQ8_9BACI|nr:DUF3866 family protein [Tepidibacillus fermentans]TCS84070.1 uncharacterized protein DUF3866 [Tepidibacillus fermentans]
MIKWRKGKVVEILQETDKIQIVKIDIRDKEVKAIHYLQFGDRLETGDEVILNQTATHLRLGTGGYDFVAIPLTKYQSDLINNQKQNGHIMKLRYTPYQFSVLSCEEQSSPYHDLFTEPKSLEGLPVLIGELHSMLPIVVTMIRQLEIQEDLFPRRIVYIMTDGGSLPISFSKHVAILKEKKWLDYTITIGHSFGGDLEAVNIYTGLLAAKHLLHADIAVVVMGPGIVGTGTWLGHTGVEHGEIINAVNILKGYPISIIRASEMDQRSRHRGISHHSITALQTISLTSSAVPFPVWLEKDYPEIFDLLKKVTLTKHNLIPVTLKETDVIEILQKYPKVITSMGRTVKDDPLFFDFVASAAYFAHQYQKSFYS